MYLVWLRVAAVLYAGAGIAAFPTVLYQNPRWKSVCVHVGGLAFLFHFVSVVEMLALKHSWVPVGVREGESLHGALSANQVMPEMALDMIEVGESSGALAPMLNSVAEFYEEEVALRLGALVSLIEPLILVFMGLLVAFILISLYLPIFSFSISGTTK